MANKVKVCWISNAPAPYKVEFMNVLATKVELTCLFEMKSESNREKDWYNYNFQGYEVIYLNEVNAKQIIKEKAVECDVLINSDYAKKICMYAVRQFHKQGKLSYLQADGGLAIPRGLMDKVISFVMKQNDYFLSSGREVDKYFLYYGIDQSKIKHYHFACMSKEEIEENAKIIQNKSFYKEKCGYKEDVILLSVGQPIPRKGFDILCNAMKDISNNVGLYIIGGEPEECVKKIVDDNNLRNVHFLTFKSKEELKEYYAGADIFVFPTRYDIWGLVINEAMSFGLPIISTDKCVAAMEFNNNYKNAMIVRSNLDDELKRGIEQIINDDSLKNELAMKSLDGIKTYNFDNMANDFLHALYDSLFA